MPIKSFTAYLKEEMLDFPCIVENVKCFPQDLKEAGGQCVYIDEKVWYDDCAFVLSKQNLKGVTSQQCSLLVHLSSKDDMAITVHSYYCYGT